MSKQQQPPAPELSPKMQMLTAELREVLGRYDVAAVVVLHEQGAVNYFMKLDPSYSLASLTPQGQMSLAPAPPNIMNPAVPSQPAHETVNLFRNLAAMTQRVLQSLSNSLMTAQAYYNLYPPGVKGMNGKHPGKR